MLKLSRNYQWSFPEISIPYAQEGLKLAHKLNSEGQVINFYHSLSEALSVSGNYPAALEIAFKALHLSEKSKDPSVQYWGLISVGNTYFYSGDYQSALKYYRQAKESKTALPQTEELILGFIGESYFGLNEMDSALFYIQKSYNLGISQNQYWSVPYFYMAAINIKKEQYKMALDYYRKGINISTNNLDFVDGYIGMASAFQKSNMADSAILYAQKALTVSQHASLISKSVEASTILTDLYTGNRITDSAFKYQSIMVAAKASLFSKGKIMQMQNISFNEQMRQDEIKSEREKFLSQIKLYALLGVLFIFLLVALLLWRNNRNKQKAYSLLQKQKQEIDRQKTIAERTLNNLKSTQKQLIQSEKMASLGELTAGIAHEIQNPLNFVNNFSDVNTELLGELKAERLKQKAERDEQTEDEIINDVIANEQKINHHGKRAGDIVKGMLQHSRASTGVKEPTDINALVDEYLRLSYHGMKAKDKNFNAVMKTDFDESIGKINIIPQDIGRVLLNLYNNAFYAVHQNQKEVADQRLATLYEPTISVTTKKSEDSVLITASDNGNGIPKNIVDKIFQPFFTTKPSGQGTGLGLSLSYDIVKAHGGELKIKTEEGKGSEFVIQLPLK